MGDQEDRTEPDDSGGSSRPGKLAAAVILIAYSPDSDTPNQPAGEQLPATLGAVPTNRVDGRGTATVRLKGKVATVALETNGLLLDDAHVMHIHAGERGTCPTPAAARPHNGNLSIGTLDGAAFYGSPRISLTTRGDTGVVSILEFARYPSTGGITYKRAIELRPRTIRFLQAISTPTWTVRPPLRRCAKSWSPTQRSPRARASRARQGRSTRLPWRSRQPLPA